MAFLSAAPLDPTALTDCVLAARRGAITSFLGVVRDHHGGAGSDFTSSYGPMAEAECAACGGGRGQGAVPVGGRARLGRLVIGEYRCDRRRGRPTRRAFAACRHVIAGEAAGPSGNGNEYATDQAWSIRRGFRDRRRRRTLTSDVRALFARRGLAPLSGTDPVQHAMGYCCRTTSSLAPLSSILSFEERPRLATLFSAPAPTIFASPVLISAPRHDLPRSSTAERDPLHAILR